MATKRRVVIEDAGQRTVALNVVLQESVDDGKTWTTKDRKPFSVRGQMKEHLDELLTSSVYPLVVERVSGSAINRG